MSQNTRIIERILPIWAVAPANYTGVPNTIQYVSMKNFERMGVAIVTGAWAGGTAAVTVNQATNIAAGTNKALAFSFMWSSTSTSATVTKNAVVSNTFNLSAANTLYWIEFVQSDLDIDNAYTCIGVSIASPGSNADFYSVAYIGDCSKYPMPVQLDVMVN